MGTQKNTRNVPAKVEHVVNLSVSEMRSFVTGFVALKVEFFDIRIRSDGTRLVHWANRRTVLVNAEKMFLVLVKVRPLPREELVLQRMRRLLKRGAPSKGANEDENKLEQPSESMNTTICTGRN